MWSVVVQCGNNRMPCFLDDEDRHRYLQCLREALLRYGCVLHAYVLMSNHVDLLFTPGKVGAVSRLMQTIGRNCGVVQWPGMGELEPVRLGLLPADADTSGGRVSPLRRIPGEYARPPKQDAEKSRSKQDLSRAHADGCHLCLIDRNPLKGERYMATQRNLKATFIDHDARALNTSYEGSGKSPVAVSASRDGQAESQLADVVVELPSESHAGAFVRWVDSGLGAGQAPSWRDDLVTMYRLMLV